MGYDYRKIEPKWQEYWEKNRIYRAEDFSEKPKYFVLVEFPYPSGAGLHIGHARSYTAMDIISRFKRMKGFNVLYPIGWDAFGLPTENYAIKTGIHPREATLNNIANFKRQMKSLGFSFDWDREIDTTDPKYYKWTQWIFLKLFEKGLAYQARIPVNWCPSCKIGLANEEVVGGKCERCGEQVEQKELKQWVLKITDYADRLIEDLEKVNYLQRIKTQQIDWIGRSYGTKVKFKLDGSKENIEVFTTRIDTIFGVTALVLAPEHPLVSKITSKDNKGAVLKYIKNSREKSEFERTKLDKEKTGVFTGAYCINPLNNEKVEIWIGDYVVATYGGGAVMVVPAHDKRDYDFAKKYGLKIKEVIRGGNIEKEAFVEYGRLVNSGEFSGLSSEKAINKITQSLEEEGLGEKTVNYKLRDWIFSRQHYWGEPIPVVHCQKCGIVPVDEKDLPVELPYVEKYKPTATGDSPLSEISDWVNVKCPKCGGHAKRETDTMPNWAGSNWYYIRYCDPENNESIASKDKLKYWMNVDWYDGGMEHTTLHLLYSRFIYKFLYDIDVASTLEPYQKRTAHGMILAQDGRKMSKSFGNVINPDDIVSEYGADTLRMYEMFMGPFDQAIAWNTQGVKGMNKFINKVFDLILECKDNQESSKEALKQIHKLNKKIEEDIENMKFNTCVSSFMEFINFVTDNKKETSKDILKRFIILFSLFAPHAGEELWEIIGEKETVFNQKWPVYDKSLIKDDKYTLVVQINGKIRDQVKVKSEITEEEAKNIALSKDKIKNWIKDKEIKKIIFIPKKLINIVCVE